MNAIALRSKTPVAWAERVLAPENLPAFLADHAVCELQASVYALSLVPDAARDLIVVHVVPPSHDSCVHRLVVPPLLLRARSARTVMPAMELTEPGRPKAYPQNRCWSLVVAGTAPAPHDAVPPVPLLSSRATEPSSVSNQRLKELLKGWRVATPLPGTVAAGDGVEPGKLCPVSGLACLEQTGSRCDIGAHGVRRATLLGPQVRDRVKIEIGRNAFDSKPLLPVDVDRLPRNITRILRVVSHLRLEF